MGDNAHSFTRRVTKKRSYGRYKNMNKKKKSKIIMSLKIYIMTSYFLVMTQSGAEIKQSPSKLIKCLLLTQDLCHIW